MKRDSLLLYIIQFTLLFFSVIFSSERMLFTDTSLFVVKVSEGNFYCPLNRFCAIFTQVLPVIGTYFNLSLSKIILLYSINTQFIYFIAFFYLLSVRKMFNYALAFTLFQLLFTVKSFFLPISELPIGISLLFILFSFTKKEVKLNPYIKYLFFGLFTFFIGTSHILIAFALIAGIALLFVLKNMNIQLRYKSVITVCVIALIIAIINALFFPSPYEIDKINTLHTENLEYFLYSNLRNVILYNSLPYFAIIFFTSYYLFNLWKKNAISLILLIVIFSGTNFVMTLFSDSSPYINSIFFEIYQCTTPFVLSISLFYTLNMFNENKQIIFKNIIFVLLFAQCVNICYHSYYFKNKIEHYACIINNLKNNSQEKTVLVADKTQTNNNLKQETFHIYESLLISNLIEDKNILFTTYFHSENYIKGDSLSDLALSNFVKNKQFEIDKNINSKYFQLSNTPFTIDKMYDCIEN